MFSITLQTPDTAVTANDVLGRLGFAASSETGSDAVLVSAIIKAVAEDTFDANNNPTSLVFCTANSEDADSSERMRINNDGDVGIGTSSPLYKLDVSGTFSADSINVNDAFTFPTSDGSNGQILVTDGAGTVSWTSGGGGVSGTGTSNYVARWTSSTVLGTGVIYDNGTNVGIGTALPSQKLEVNGTIKSSNLISDSLTFKSTNIISGGSSSIVISSILDDIVLATFNGAAEHIHCRNTAYASRPSVDINPDAGNIDFTVFHDTSTSVPLFHCDADLEKVGINTISPATLFHLRKNSTYNSENTYAIKISDGNDPETHGMLLGVDSTNDISSIQAIDPGTSWSRNLSLQAMGGNVGIGTITPAVRLHVTHDNNEAGIRVEDTTTGTYLEIGESAYTASNLYTGVTHSEYTGSQEYMLISAGSHTLVSAKTGYYSYIRAGGNNTTYQAIVQANRFAIGTNADLLIVDSEGLKAKKNIYIDRYLETNIAVGWYTVAVNAASRACGRFGLACESGSRHQGIIFYASHYYGAGNQISILHNEKYSSSNPIAKIRLKEGGTYDGCLLQVYIDDATNTPEIFLLGDNINDTGWVLTDWVADGTDPGTVANFSSLTNVAVEVDLDTVEFGTTGDAQINQIQIGSQAYSIGSHTQGITHVDYDNSQSYMMISDGDNTYTSCHNLSGFNYMRGPQNGTAYQVVVGNTYMFIGTTSTERMTVGSTETVFNQDGHNYDFRVEGDTDTDLLFVDAGTDKVGVSTNTPAQVLDVTTYESEGLGVNFQQETAPSSAGGFQSLITESVSSSIITKHLENTSNGSSTLELKNLIRYGTDFVSIDGPYTVGLGNTFDPKLFVDTDSGNVGIGTDTPAYLLDVDGDLSCNNLIVNGTTISPDGTTVLVETVNGRLTLETGVAVSTTNQTAKTTLYFTPYKGNQIALYSGSDWGIHDLTERSLSLSGYTADTNFDIFIYDNSGTLTLESVAWTDDTNRATALTTQDGVYVKSGATTRRYIGTIRTTATTGQCEDSRERRFVWSYYNQVKKDQLTTHFGTSHTYASSVWRATNNDTTVGVKRYLLVLGLDTVVNVSVNNHSKFMYTAAALDGTTASALYGGGGTNGLSGHNGDPSYNGQTFSFFRNYVGPGYHFIQEMEYGVNSSSMGFNSEIAGDHLC